MTYQPPPGPEGPRPPQPPQGGPAHSAPVPGNWPGAPQPGHDPRHARRTQPPPGQVPPPPPGPPPGQPPFGRTGPYGPGPGQPYGAPGYGQPYGQAGFGPYGSPPPPPPRRNGGIVAAVIVGVVAVVAVVAVVVTLAVTGSSPDPDRETVATESTELSSTPPTAETPEDSGSTASQAEILAIRESMQTFVDALNSRDIIRIRAAVCSELRPRISNAPDGDGNVVLEGLLGVSVTGDSAESTVITHVESGPRRSVSKQNDERFVRESGTWYVCPGSEPDIGA